MRKILCAGILLVCVFQLKSQQTPYPDTVRYVTLQIERQQVRMAYMDVKPTRPNGQSVLLFHGKNFNGYYWKDVIAFLSAGGYRVIVPDQIGFGMSDKPNVHYSFSLLAANTHQLLDSLGIVQINVIAHSMGGMLATRFALMYPGVVRRLIYENPIGLEDYRTFVPYHSVDDQFGQERKSDYNSLKKYQQSYYPEWKPAYEQYVAAQLHAMQIPDMETAAWASALTYDMIYQEPVVYEFRNITQPTLIIIGQADRTIVGKKLVPAAEIDRHGQYPALGKMFHQQIKSSTLVELNGVGHIPHIQSPEIFKEKVMGFLK